MVYASVRFRIYALIDGGFRVGLNAAPSIISRIQRAISRAAPGAYFHVVVEIGKFLPAGLWMVGGWAVVAGGTVAVGVGCGRLA